MNYPEPSWVNGPSRPPHHIETECPSCGTDWSHHPEESIESTPCSCGVAACCEECPRCACCSDRVCAQCSVDISTRSKAKQICAECHKTYLYEGREDEISELREMGLSL